jgi:hypothetical protein
LAAAKNIGFASACCKTLMRRRWSDRQLALLFSIQRLFAARGRMMWMWMCLSVAERLHVSPMRSGVLMSVGLVKPRPHVSHATLPVSTRCHGAGARLQGERVVLRMQLSSVTASMVISEWTRTSTSSQLQASTYRCALPGRSSIPPTSPHPASTNSSSTSPQPCNPASYVGKVTSAASYVFAHLLDFCFPLRRCSSPFHSSQLLIQSLLLVASRCCLISRTSCGTGFPRAQHHPTSTNAAAWRGFDNISPPHLDSILVPATHARA